MYRYMCYDLMCKMYEVNKIHYFIRAVTIKNLSETISYISNHAEIQFIYISDFILTACLPILYSTPIVYTTKIAFLPSTINFYKNVRDFHVAHRRYMMVVVMYIYIYVFLFPCCNIIKSRFYKYFVLSVFMESVFPPNFYYYWNWCLTTVQIYITVISFCYANAKHSTDKRFMNILFLFLELRVEICVRVCEWVTLNDLD